MSLTMTQMFLFSRLQRRKLRRLPKPINPEGEEAWLWCAFSQPGLLSFLPFGAPRFLTSSPRGCRSRAFPAWLPLRMESVPGPSFLFLAA